MTENIAGLIRGLTPLDDLEKTHRAEAIRWMAVTSDIFRRQSSPVEPRQHLVSYFLLVDSNQHLILLGDHIKAGLWLPSGGHVEPGEDPAETVRRECREELAIEAHFHPALGHHPLFITATETNGSDPHHDVSLWFVLESSHTTTLTADPDEYHSVRWWSTDEVRAADPSRFDPHMTRMLNKVRDSLWNQPTYPPQ